MEMKDSIAEKEIRISEVDLALSVQYVSKKYSQKLRSSLFYGLKDIASELFIRREQRSSIDLRKDEFWALNNITFDLKRGDSLAIIGDNGSGKSTLLKLIYGLIRPDAGKIFVNGTVGAIIELGSGFNPILTGRENIYIQAALLGISQEESDSFMHEIVEFAGLGEFIDTPVQFYSSGMSARLAFSVMTALKPDILLIDEVLAVGDIHFQRKCVDMMYKYLSSGGTLVFVSHSAYLVQSVCKKAVLI
ncbi:MAG: ABC transporter ATP-binding protein, partial [Acidobacteria bacterium]|nr:ABC transporter ATP-binding protein [Acidobacteriota bacterium]